MYLRSANGSLSPEVLAIRGQRFSSNYGNSLLIWWMVTSSTNSECEIRGGTGCGWSTLGPSIEVKYHALFIPQRSTRPLDGPDREADWRWISAREAQTSPMVLRWGRGGRPLSTHPPQPLVSPHSCAVSHPVVPITERDLCLVPTKVHISDADACSMRCPIIEI